MSYVIAQQDQVNTMPVPAASLGVLALEPNGGGTPLYIATPGSGPPPVYSGNIGSLFTALAALGAPGTVVPSVTTFLGLQAWMASTVWPVWSAVCNSGPTNYIATVVSIPGGGSGGLPLNTQVPIYFTCGPGRAQYTLNTSATPMDAFVFYLDPATSHPFLIEAQVDGAGWHTLATIDLSQSPYNCTNLAQAYALLGITTSAPSASSGHTMTGTPIDLTRAGMLFSVSASDGGSPNGGWMLEYTQSGTHYVADNGDGPQFPIPYGFFVQFPGAGPDGAPPVNVPTDGGTVPVNPTTIPPSIPVLPAPPAGVTYPQIVDVNQTFGQPLDTFALVQNAYWLRRNNLTGILNENLTLIQWWLSVLADIGTTAPLNLIIDLNGFQLQNIAAAATGTDKLVLN